MKRWLISDFALLLLLPSWTFSQTPPPEARLADEEIIQKLSHRVRWDWFWNGYTHPDYAEGKIIPVAVLESADEVAVFFAELGEYLAFDPEGRITEGRRFPDTANQIAIDEYLRTFGDTSGPSDDAGHDPRAIGETRASMGERSLEWVLPELEPPEYIAQAQAPPGLPEFEAAVRVQARYWYDASCGMGQLSIPYFSPDDPVVFVYGELGMCGVGIFDFHLLSNGQWELGRLWQHGGSGSPNDWSHTIQRILENRLATIPVP